MGDEGMGVLVNATLPIFVRPFEISDPRFDDALCTESITGALSVAPQGHLSTYNDVGSVKKNPTISNTISIADDQDGKMHWW